MYEEMYHEMKVNHSDFVICDYHEYDEKDSDKDTIEKEYTIKILDKTGMFDMIYPYRGYVWQALFLKERIKNVRFDTTIYVAEDLKFICEYIVNCESSGVYIQKALYHYVKRKDSITSEANLSKTELSNGVINLLESEKQSKEIIENYSKDEELLTKVKKSMIIYYWITIYDLLKHDFKDNMPMVKKYCKEVKEYEKYFSKKDKLYMVLLEINPKIFQIVCKNLRNIKNFTNKGGN